MPRLDPTATWRAGFVRLSLFPYDPEDTCECALTPERARRLAADLLVAADAVDQSEACEVSDPADDVRSHLRVTLASACEHRSRTVFPTLSLEICEGCNAWRIRSGAWAHVEVLP